MENKISISNGNSKMGKIPSVSLPPVKTCASGCPCAQKCYAVKLCRIYKTVKNAYDHNLSIWETDPDGYFSQVSNAMKMSRFFRMHVSGDFPTFDYFLKFIDTVRENPHCEVLVFTKRYSFVNAFLFCGKTLPENLHLIFSDWCGMRIENPYNLPIAHVVFKGGEPLNSWKECTGNCETCARSGSGCWGLKNGEHVFFWEH